MFRHVLVALKRLFNLGADARALQVTPQIGVPPLPERVDLPSPFSGPVVLDRRNSPARRRHAADNVGRAFPNPWAEDLPAGYFWKQDDGAVDLDRRRAPRLPWRIYRRRVHGS